MKYIELDAIQKKASQIVMGTYMPIMINEPENGAEYLNHIHELGINTFDCSATYGEEAIGKWFEKYPEIRDKVIIHSKCCRHNKWRTRMNDFDIYSDAHDSLARLKTDYIDIYVLHRDNPAVNPGSLIEAFNRLKSDGKIRAFGVSNWTRARIEEANEYAYKHNLTPFTSSSPNFGLAQQYEDPWGGGCVSISGPENRDSVEWYGKRDMPVFAYSCLGRGFFSGLFKSDDSEGAKKNLDEHARAGYMYPSNFERLKRVEVLAKEKNCTVPQIAMAWILNQPLKVFAITSPVTLEMMKENIKAAEIKLSGKEIDWLDLRISER